MITSPCLIGLVTVTVAYDWPPVVLGWFGLGVLGLVVAVASDRTATTEFSLITWPRAGSRDDLVVSAIAYNAVLIIGTVLGQVAWIASQSPPLAAGVGAILPVWFLKHIRFLVFLDDD